MRKLRALATPTGASCSKRPDARELPFGDDFFDRAFSMFVLNFIPDAQRVVAEMRRVVRPGGTATAAVWDTFSG
jgi:ubiquinone/menaquinone biosynthesis C-methylase UbiE